MISFNVIGVPQQQGSMKAFVVGKRAIVTSDNTKLKPWRSCVFDAALKAMGGAPMEMGPVEIWAEFRIQRPASSPKTRETLPDKTPDLDKLARGLFDALTGVCWDDDKRVVRMHISERYTDRNGEQPGVSVSIERIEL